MRIMLMTCNVNSRPCNRGMNGLTGRTADGNPAYSCPSCLVVHFGPTISMLHFNEDPYEVSLRPNGWLCPLQLGRTHTYTNRILGACRPGQSSAYFGPPIYHAGGALDGRGFSLSWDVDLMSHFEPLGLIEDPTTRLTD